MHSPDTVDILATLLMSGGLASAAYWKGVLDLKGTLTASAMGIIIGLSLIHI